MIWVTTPSAGLWAELCDMWFIESCVCVLKNVLWKNKCKVLAWTWAYNRVSWPFNMMIWVTGPSAGLWESCAKTIIRQMSHWWPVNELISQGHMDWFNRCCCSCCHDELAFVVCVLKNVLWKNKCKVLPWTWAYNRVSWPFNMMIWVTTPSAGLWAELCDMWFIESCVCVLKNV